MRAFLLSVSGLLILGCASHAEQPPQAARVAPAVVTERAPNAAPSPAVEPVETSHVYLLLPGKDAVRVVVSR
jgi:hypothetical protein